MPGAAALVMLHLPVSTVPVERPLTFEVQFGTVGRLHPQTQPNRGRHFQFEVVLFVLTGGVPAGRGCQQVVGCMEDSAHIKAVEGNPPVISTDTQSRLPSGGHWSSPTVTMEGPQRGWPNMVQKQQGYYPHKCNTAEPSPVETARACICMHGIT